MVKSFQFARIPQIYFKSGIISELPGLALKYGTRLILVTGRRSFYNSGIAEKLFNDFDKAGITCEKIIISGEPSPENIDEAVNKFKSKHIDLIVSIGGGSVIDAGKAISAMMYKKESVVHFLEGVGDMDHSGARLPFIAIPTTAGTGSEATKNAVISKIGKDGFKRSLRHDNFVPDIAVVDPGLTLKCPPEITASSGMDCFTQLTEAYLSSKSYEYTDALSIAGLKAIKDSLTRSYTNGEDIEARTGMSFAALTSGICIANAGLGVVHGFASSIGGMFNIPHGLVCGTLMAMANEVNVRELRKKDSNRAALKKYASLGKLFIEETGKTDDYYIDGFIEYLKKLTSDLQLPGLGKYGLADEDIVMISEKTELKNNPVKLDVQDLTEILSKRLH